MSASLSATVSPESGDHLFNPWSCRAVRLSVKVPASSGSSVAGSAAGAAASTGAALTVDAIAVPAPTAVGNAEARPARDTSAS